MFRQALQQSTTGIRQRALNKLPAATKGRRFTTAAEPKPDVEPVVPTSTTTPPPAVDEFAHIKPIDGPFIPKPKAETAKTQQQQEPLSSNLKAALDDLGEALKARDHPDQPFKQAQDALKRQAAAQEKKGGAPTAAPASISDFPLFIQHQIHNSQGANGRTRFMMQELTTGPDGKAITQTYRGTFCPEKGLEMTQTNTKHDPTMSAPEITKRVFKSEAPVANKALGESTLPPLTEYAAINRKPIGDAAEQLDAEYQRRLLKAAKDQERLMGTPQTDQIAEQLRREAVQAGAQAQRAKLRRPEGDFGSEFADFDRLVAQRNNRALSRLESELESEFERERPMEIEMDFFTNPASLRNQIRSLQKDQQRLLEQNERLAQIERIKAKQQFLQEQNEKLARMEAHNFSKLKSKTQAEAQSKAQAQAQRDAAQKAAQAQKQQQQQQQKEELTELEEPYNLLEHIFGLPVKNRSLYADRQARAMADERCGSGINGCGSSAIQKGAEHAKTVQKLAQQQAPQQAQKQQQLKDKAQQEAAKKYVQQQQENAAKKYLQQQEAAARQYAQQQQEAAAAQQAAQQAAAAAAQAQAQAEAAAAAAQAQARAQAAQLAAHPHYAATAYYQPGSGFTPQSFLQWAHDLHRNMDQFHGRVHQLEQLTDRLRQAKGGRQARYAQQQQQRRQQQQEQDQLNQFFAPPPTPFFHFQPQHQHISPFGQPFPSFGGFGGFGPFGRGGFPF